jgi:hypothetical protein
LSLFRQLLLFVFFLVLLATLVSHACSLFNELWVQALVVIVATWLGLEASREAEPKVIVAERRIELTAQRDAANRVRVAPRSAARGAAHALVGAGGIPLR